MASHAGTASGRPQRGPGPQLRAYRQDMTQVTEPTTEQLVGAVAHDEAADPFPVRGMDHVRFHVGNAREDEQGRVVLDAIRYSRDAWFQSWSRSGGIGVLELLLKFLRVHRYVRGLGWRHDLIPPTVGPKSNHGEDDQSEDNFSTSCHM